MLVSADNPNKKPYFFQVSKANYLLSNDLLNHRLFFDFKTDTVDYRLRMLSKLTTDLEKHPIYLQINFKYKGQAGIAFCETSIITALLDLEATDFEINKLTPAEINALFGVIQRMIEENYAALTGLLIEKLQFASLKALQAIPVSVMPIQTLVKITSIEHFSYMHLFLSSPYLDLLQSTLQECPVVADIQNPPQLYFKQDLELLGCTLNQQEMEALAVGDVLVFNQGDSDYRINLDDQFYFSITAKKNKLSLLRQSEKNNHLTNDPFNISIKLHQALVQQVEDADILQVAQQQIEHAEQTSLKTLYCNDKPFALAERISICDRLAMHIQSFL